MRHASLLINDLKRDRAQGASLTELVKKYSLSKTTIWHHVRNVKMPEQKRRLVNARRGGSTIEHQLDWEKAMKEANNLLRRFNERSQWPILLAALYWGEGTKRSGFVFTNTDEWMIKLVVKMLRENLHVKNSDLDVLIRTCTPMDSEECRIYWSGVLNLSRDQIKVNHNNLHNRSKTLHGMCRITVRKGSYRLKLMHCLIKVLTAKMLNSRIAPVAQWIELRSPNAAM